MTLDWTNAGALPARATDPRRGTNQAGVRAYNERLLLSLIRRDVSLPKAEMAQATGLSAQTVSVIVRQLEDAGLVRRDRPRRGKVGQPLIPFSLNPDGAYFIGVKVGRRTGDVVLLDLAGTIKAKVHEPYPYPAPEEYLRFIERGIATVTRGLDAGQRARIAGLGIAAPFELWNWEDAVGAPHHVMAAWRDFDIQAETAARCDWPVHFCNDATAACAAELLFGRGAEHPDYVYLFVSAFAGGGVVLNGALQQGRTGNAGAAGSMPVAAPGGGTQQLIRAASLYVLERDLLSDGIDPAVLWKSPEDWGDLGAPLDRWIDRAASSLAQAVAAAAAVMDFSAAIIDAACPGPVRARLVARVRDKLNTIDTRGLSPIAVLPGSLGGDARALGAACLPLLATYAVDRDVLFKEPI